MTKTKEDDVAMTLRLPAAWHRQLTTITKRFGISKAGYIRMVLAAALTQDK